LAFTQSYTNSVGNANFGWMLGGFNTSGTVTSQVNRITFANDTATGSQRGLLTTVRGSGSALSNNNYAWAGGGGDFANINQWSSVDRIDFANDSPSTASARGFLTQAKTSIAGLSNTFYGWFAGGRIPTPAVTSRIERIDFANDSPTSASARGPLSSARYAAASLSNTAFGWVVAGATLPFSQFSSVERIDFANDSPTSASFRGPLSNSLIQGAGTNNQFFGWVIGGSPFPSTSLVQRIDFSNDLAAVSIRGNMAENKYGHGGTSNYVKTTPIFNVTQYSKGANSVGIGAGTFGWWSGGSSSVERIDFANDSPATASVRGPLSTNRTYPSAIGNSNFGWWAGGYNGPAGSIARINFANDSPTVGSPRSSMNAQRSAAGAVGNSNFGWLAGGIFSGLGLISSVERIDFANDAVLPLLRSTLTAGRGYGGSASNLNYGWFGGGQPTPSLISIVERIDFSNDNLISVIRGPLTAGRSQIASASNLNYGWFGGGAQPTRLSTVDRIDFSNDSPTSASPRGPLSLARFGFSAASNANYGWFAGGFATGLVSLVDRIDFANDSAIASTRGPSAAARQTTAATSNYTK
jgi:hypothetical protein